MVNTTCTKVAFTMCGHFNSDDCCAQVGDLAKKFDGTLFIAVFHLAIRGAHSADWLNTALDAFCNSRAFAISKVQKRILPNCLNACVPRAKQILLRNYANSNFSISVQCEGGRTPAAVIDSV